eukprot:TRINITY_DN1227_c2_g5_i1.p2 TRINITY_DN1227_c2_g5~~TRINITY_DN1227_c2_g5_i1.p2  ORF type:complete len:146 (-),score=3.50 TRINITY_DN1227_c2_g5_i1:119-502(-)
MLCYVWYSWYVMVARLNVQKYSLKKQYVLLIILLFIFFYGRSIIWIQRFHVPPLNQTFDQSPFKFKNLSLKYQALFHHTTYFFFLSKKLPKNSLHVQQQIFKFFGRARFTPKTLKKSNLQTKKNNYI